MYNKKVKPKYRHAPILPLTVINNVDKNLLKTLQSSDSNNKNDNSNFKSFWETSGRSDIISQNETN